MSTDQHSPSAELTAALRLRHESFTVEVNPALQLALAYDAAAEIWSGVDAWIYTEHGTEHSLRVVQHFMALNTKYEWSDYEKVVFALAALVHDIGMQYNKWGGAQTDDERRICDVLNTAPPPLDWNEVRKQHVVHGEALAKLEVDGKRSWKLPKAFCTTTEGARTLFYHACLVAFAHGGGSQWDDFKDESKGDYASDRPCPFGGRDYSLRSLAGVLRFCDELDGRYVRIKQPDELFRSDLPRDSKLHWLACLYTEAVTTEVTKEGVVDVQVRVRLPRERTDQVERDIYKLLNRMRIKRINDTGKLVDEMFNAARAKPTWQLVTGARFAPNKVTTFPHTLTKEIAELLRDQDNILDEKSPAPPRHSKGKSGRRAAAGRDSIEVQPFAALPNLVTDDSDVQKRMVDWVRLNQQPGHFSLVRGACTDVLIYVRGVVAQTDLVRDMASWILRRTRGRQFAKVIGVGTSALPVVVRVAFASGAPMTYMSHLMQEDSRPGLHSLGEMADFDGIGGGSVLVVDSLVARGRTADYVVRQLMDRGMPPNRIVYVSLIRLTSAKLLRKVRGVSYLSVCDVPDVHFWSDKKTCPSCRKKLEFTDERANWPTSRQQRTTC